MIGIIGAMQVEIEDLKAQLDHPVQQRISGIEFVSGTLGKVPVVLAVCGIGKVFAALCAQTMILNYGVSAVINTGVAGTLCRELGIGDVAISADVVQHDFDTSVIGDRVGLISGLDMVHIPADAALAQQARQAVEERGIHCRVGTIATGDQFLCQQERKEWIHNTFHAIAVEMEGGSIGQVCHVNGVPFVVIRAISDDADGHAPDNYAAFVEQTAKASAQVTAAMVKGISHEQGMDCVSAEN